MYIRSNRGLTLQTSIFRSFYCGQFTLPTQLIKSNYLVQCNTPHWCNSTVSLETHPLYERHSLSSVDWYRPLIPFNNPGSTLHWTISDDNQLVGWNMADYQLTAVHVPVKCPQSVDRVSIGMPIKFWSRCWSRVTIKNIDQHWQSHGCHKNTMMYLLFHNI